MELMFQPLRKYAAFDGRARRKEFWLFWLFTIVLEMIVGAVTGGAASLVRGGGLGIGGTLYCLLVLALLVPSLAVAFRRLHDTNRSAWWLFIGLVPIIGAIVLLVFYCTDGTKGPNRFGPDPKGDDVEVFA